MSQILISGSLAYDHIMVFPGYFKEYFIPDKLHNINVSFTVPNHQEHFGGTAGNVAYSLALLGEEAAIIATVGDDFERYRTHLEELNIPTESIHVAEGKQTAFAYVITDKGDNQIAAYHPGAGAVAYGSDVPARSDSIALISAGCTDDIRALPDIYRGNGTRFLFDPGQSILALTGDDLRNGITDAEAVFVNDYEFALIKNMTGWGEAEVLKVANALVITLGEEGSRVLTKEGEVKVHAVKVTENIDPTGAGDAYRAGYIKGIRLGWPPSQCAKLGSATAVYAVEHMGTQNHRFTVEELKERYESAYSETLVLS
ncbi:MAG: carbohydrate kinase family protein [Patescibacteria group bacterium]